MTEHPQSLLFVSGATPERFEKACVAGADMVCIDLEDAVAPGLKEKAREEVITFLSGYDGQTVAGLRVNATGTLEGREDLKAIAKAGLAPAFIMVPKIANAAELDDIAAIVGQVPMFPVIESAVGMLEAPEICDHHLVRWVLFGGVDYSADISATLEWDALLYARGTLVNACAAGGAVLFDVPFLDVKDEEGLIAATRRARAIGIHARAAIHPAQIAGIHKAYAPSTEEISEAEDILAAFRAAEGGAALHRNKLIELPVIKAAERVLAAAKNRK